MQQLCDPCKLEVAMRWVSNVMFLKLIWVLPILSYIADVDIDPVKDRGRSVFETQSRGRLIVKILILTFVAIV